LAALAVVAVVAVVAVTVVAVVTEVAVVTVGNSAVWHALSNTDRPIIVSRGKVLRFSVVKIGRIKVKVVIKVA